jgi:hypothetical protein
MRDVKELVRHSNAKYRYQPGMIGTRVEGKPASGIRYLFVDETSAMRFVFIRGLLRDQDPHAGELHVDGCDVVESWGELPGIGARPDG